MDIYKQDKYKQTNSDVVALRFQRVHIYPSPPVQFVFMCAFGPLPRSQPCLPSESQSATPACYLFSSTTRNGSRERARERGGGENSCGTPLLSLPFTLLSIWRLSPSLLYKLTALLKSIYSQCLYNTPITASPGTRIQLSPRLRNAP